MSFTYPTQRLIKSWQTRLNKFKIVLPTQKIRTMIIVKSREEIELMRESALIVSKH
jgi:Xaa-Pro aminopeptidase